jgi:vacuolar iron transporter family protein
VNSLLNRHLEGHASHRLGWLRAAVLGANDGLISTASLILGVAAAGATSGNILSAGIAGLVAGAMSIAAGEYVSVSTQADAEKADIVREAKELEIDPEHELAELTAIYVGRGLKKETAIEVASQLTEQNALAAHTRDELGISESLSANPLQAAVASAASFAVGAALPLAIAALVSAQHLLVAVTSGSIGSLVLLGAVSAYVGRAPIFIATVRVTFWGVFAMGVTWGVGKFFQ